MSLTGTSNSWTVEEITIISWNVSVTCVFLFGFDICSFYSGGLDISLLFIKKQDSGLRLLIHLSVLKQPTQSTTYLQFREIGRAHKKSRNVPKIC